MHVTNLKLPKLLKVSQAKPGNLVRMYNCNLGDSGVFIVAAAAFNVVKVLNADTGEVKPIPPTAPSGGGWGQPSEVVLFDPVSGELLKCSGEMRCHIYRGAAVVLDFVEGA